MKVIPEIIIVIAIYELHFLQTRFSSRFKKQVIFADKRKLNADGEYDPSSPTSENNDETPAKKLALTSDTESDAKLETKPASPKKKSLPELEKYWKAVNEDPSDFTGWTYLLQYVDQEVRNFYFHIFTFPYYIG